MSFRFEKGPKNQMPDLSKLSDQEFDILQREIYELQALSHHGPNVLGSRAQLQRDLEFKKKDAQKRLDRYNELTAKYPWFTYRPTLEVARSKARLMEGLSAATGSMTADSRTAEDYQVKQTLEKQYSIDLVDAEYRRRRGIADPFSREKSY